MATSVTVVSSFVNDDHFQSKNTPIYVYGGVVDAEADVIWYGTTANAIGTYGGPSTVIAEQYFRFNGDHLLLGDVSALGTADYGIIVGSTDSADVGAVRVVGNQTSAAAVGSVSFHNHSSVETDKMIAEIYGFRDGNNSYGSLYFKTSGAAGMLHSYQMTRSEHRWYADGGQKLSLGLTNMQPYGVGDIDLGTVVGQWKDIWATGTAYVGEVRVSGLSASNATNRLVWADAEGDLIVGAVLWDVSNRILSLGEGEASSALDFENSGSYPWKLTGSETEFTLTNYTTDYITVTGSLVTINQPVRLDNLAGGTARMVVADADGDLSAGDVIDITVNEINFADSTTVIRLDSAGAMIFEDGVGGPYELSELVMGNLSGQVTSTGLVTVLDVTAITAQAEGTVLADTDEFLYSDGGVIKRIDASIIKTYAGAPAYGTDNQIPRMNAGGTAFEYGADFTYDGIDLIVAGGIIAATLTSGTSGDYILTWDNATGEIVYDSALSITGDGVRLNEVGGKFAFGSDSSSYIMDTSGNMLFTDDSNVDVTLSALVTDTVYVHPNHSGHVTSVADGAQTLVVAAITGQAEGTVIVDTDEFLYSDGGVIKRVDASVIKTYAGGGSAPAYGTTTQIPYMDIGGTDFIYSPDFTYDGSNLEVDGIKTDGLIEHTTNAGVTIEGVVLKDGDIVIPYSTGQLKFGDGNTYMYESADNILELYIGAVSSMQFQATGTVFNVFTRPNGDKTLNLGHASYFWDNVYVDRLYVDVVGTYIDVSGTDMAFTSVASGTVTLADLVHDSSYWANSSPATTATVWTPAVHKHIRADIYTEADNDIGSLIIDLDDFETNDESCTVNFRLSLRALHDDCTIGIYLRNSGNSTILSKLVVTSTSPISEIWGVVLMWDETAGEWTILSVYEN